jgi:aryl sulfotransferase
MIDATTPAQRDYQSNFTDSTRWQSFQPRAGDIVVNTPPKAGTTWTQGILALLISGDPDVDAQTSLKSPWIDFNRRDLSEVVERLAAQQHRRQVKSHTPFDGLPIWPQLRYISVYRHPIDIHFSYLKHVSNYQHDMGDAPLSDHPSDNFRQFLEPTVSGHLSLSDIVYHYRCTLELEPRENFLRLHYKDMLADLTGAVDRIAAHVAISHPPDLMATLVAAATFASMKSNADRFTPSAGQEFWRSDAGFFDSASSNKWQGRLTDADLAAYDDKISSLLDAPQRAWLEWGNAAAPA